MGPEAPCVPAAAGCPCLDLDRQAGVCGRLCDVGAEDLRTKRTMVGCTEGNNYVNERRCEGESCYEEQNCFRGCLVVSTRADSSRRAALHAITQARAQSVSLQASPAIDGRTPARLLPLL